MTRVTLKDLAARAKVSWKTVSRVAKGKPGGVSAEKRAEIEQLMAETGYRANWAGRALAEGRRNVIALVLWERVRHYYNAELQIGAMGACAAAGYSFVTEAVGAYVLEGPARVEAWLDDLKPAGLILMAPLCDSQPFLDVLDALAVRYVRVSPGVMPGRGASLVLDEVGAVRAITERLLDEGHRRLGYIGLGGLEEINGQRLEGFHQALSGRGISLRPEWIPKPPDHHHDGFVDAQAMLGKADRPTAIVCASDTIAFGVLAAAASLGLLTPADVSVVGFDNAPGSESTWPPLTTIAQPIRRIGALAADLLLDMQDSPKPTDAWGSRTIDCTIAVRGSTSAPRP